MLQILLRCQHDFIFIYFLIIKHQLLLKSCCQQRAELDHPVISITTLKSEAKPNIHSYIYCSYSSFSDWICCCRLLDSPKANREWCS